MNKITLMLVAFLSVVYGFALGKYQVFPYQQIAAIKKQMVEPPKPATDFVRSPYFESQVSYFSTNKLPRYDWVFVGDSMTERAYWHEFFTDVTVANRAIGGDITKGVLNRMDTIIDTKATLALLMIGVNDIGWGFEPVDIVKRQQQIIEQLQSAGMKVVVQSIILTDGKVYNNQKIVDLNNRLKAYCKTQDVLFLDLNSHLAPDGFLQDNYSADGIHLSGPGYQVWQQQLKAFLAVNKVVL